jgi:transcriptional regulator NrdR family protein
MKKQPAPSDQTKGICCVKCGCRHFEVVYTRAVRDARIMRRRACRHCGRRITTYETVVGSGRGVS